MINWQTSGSKPKKSKSRARGQAGAGACSSPICWHCRMRRLRGTVVSTVFFRPIGLYRAVKGTPTPVLPPELLLSGLLVMFLFEWSTIVIYLESKKKNYSSCHYLIRQPKFLLHTHTFNFHVNVYLICMYSCRCDSQILYQTNIYWIPTKALGIQ